MAHSENIPAIAEEKIGELLLLRISGRLDALSSPPIEKKVLGLIRQGNLKLVIDLSGVTYLSSSGMRLLLTTTKELRAVSGQLAVCKIPTNILDVLKMSGFDHVIKLFNSEEDALQYLN